MSHIHTNAGVTDTCHLAFYMHADDLTQIFTLVGQSFCRLNCLPSPSTIFSDALSIISEGRFLQVCSK